MCDTLEGCAGSKNKTRSHARGFGCAAVCSLVFLITESFFSSISSVLHPIKWGSWEVVVLLGAGGGGGANRINGSLNIICANELAFVPACAIVPLLHISGRPFFPPFFPPQVARLRSLFFLFLLLLCSITRLAHTGLWSGLADVARCSQAKAPKSL